MSPSSKGDKTTNSEPSEASRTDANSPSGQALKSDDVKQHVDEENNRGDRCSPSSPTNQGLNKAGIPPRFQFRSPKAMTMAGTAGELHPLAKAAIGKHGCLIM